MRISLKLNNNLNSHLKRHASATQNLVRPLSRTGLNNAVENLLQKNRSYVNLSVSQKSILKNKLHELSPKINVTSTKDLRFDLENNKHIVDNSSPLNISVHNHHEQSDNKKLKVKKGSRRK